VSPSEGSDLIELRTYLKSALHDRRSLADIIDNLKSLGYIAAAPDRGFIYLFKNHNSLSNFKSVIVLYNDGLFATSFELKP
jgi:hypothetical protein